MNTKNTQTKNTQTKSTHSSELDAKHDAKLNAIRTALSPNWDATEIDNVIAQAEPYINDMSGKVMVIKCSGSILTDPNARKSFVGDICCLKQVGINPIVIHGGGDQISQKLSELGIKAEFHDGLRVTNEETMKTVSEVLLEIGAELCADINAQFDSVPSSPPDSSTPPDPPPTPQAVLLTDVIKAVPLSKKLGLVGKITDINNDKLNAEIGNGNIPIIPCLGLDDSQNSTLLNVNADTVASKVAVSLAAERLHLLTNVDGIYADFENDADSIVSSVTTKEADLMIEAGSINGGMIPKVQACLNALGADSSNSKSKNQLSAAHILNGTKPNNLLFELFTDAGIGTMIIKDTKVTKEITKTMITKESTKEGATKNA